MIMGMPYYFDFGVNYVGYDVNFSHSQKCNGKRDNTQYNYPMVSQIVKFYDQGNGSNADITCVKTETV